MLSLSSVTVSQISPHRMVYRIVWS